jgi:hypothetical protein
VTRIHTLKTWGLTDLKAHYYKQKVEVQTIIVPAADAALAVANSPVNQVSGHVNIGKISLIK